MRKLHPKKSILAKSSIKKSDTGDQGEPFPRFFICVTHNNNNNNVQLVMFFMLLCLQLCHLNVVKNMRRKREIKAWNDEGKEEKYFVKQLPLVIFNFVSSTFSFFRNIPT